MSFLKAEWRKLILINYEIAPEALQPYLPAYTELDLWQDTCYVSLVGFMFKNTRILGMKIPWHTNFEEVNLRFYVKHKSGTEWKRGVVFVKEIVPRPALSWVANTVYKEHYQTMPMRHRWEEKEGNRLLVEYAWNQKKVWYHMNVLCEKVPQAILAGTEASFITEHYWGYTRINPKTTYEYEVTHPSWDFYPIENYEVKADFEALYGPNFASLNKQKPLSVILAEGSEITVENKRNIRY